MLPKFGYSQDFLAINYTVEDGLPSNETYSTLQDSKGFIWIGTDHGVARFDGNNFEVFTTSDGLPDNTVFEFYEDHKGRIWFFCFNGRVGFFHDDEFHILPDIIPNNETYLRAIKVTPEDSLYLFPISMDRAYACAKLKGNSLDLASVELVKDRNAEEYLKVQRELQQKSYKSATKWLLGEGANRFRSMIGDHIKFTDGARLNDTSFILRNGSKNVFVVNQSIKIGAWIQYEDEYPVTGVSAVGSYVFISKTHVIEKRLRSNPNELLEVIKFPYGIASSVFIDSDGGYWVTTLDHGICYNPNRSIKTLRLESDKVDGNELSLAFKTKKGILSASKTGLIYYYSNGEFEEIAHTFGDQIQNGGRFGENWYFSNVYSALIFNDEGRHLSELSYSHEGDQRLGGFEFYQEGIDTFNVNKLFLFNNLERYKIEGSSRLAALKKIGDSIWVAGKDGLFLFSIQEQKQLHPKLPPLLKNRITDIEKYHNHLVLATRGEGILIFDKKNRVHQIKKEDGLPANAISQVIVANNRLWLSTNSGMCILTIASLSPFKYRIEKLNKEDGILGRGVDYIQYSSDTIFALSNGVFYSIPANYTSRKSRPKVYVSKIEINNKLTKFSDRMEFGFF